MTKKELLELLKDVPDNQEVRIQEVHEEGELDDPWDYPIEEVSKEDGFVVLVGETR